MFLIVGLGNPGNKYEGTRHNVGFEVIDSLSADTGIQLTHHEHKGLVGKGMIAGEKVILVKPQTFMNLSGECVAELINYYGIDPNSEMVVVSDDVTLSTGNIRVRKKGSAGGHNGLKNIIANTATSDFTRIRVGVGQVPEHGDMVSFVLGRYNETDRKRVDYAFAKAKGAIEDFLRGDIDSAMNKYNKKELFE